MPQKITIPPREGRAMAVAKDARIRLTTPKGSQCADFWAFNAQNVDEYLSCTHTWVTNFSIVPKEGDVLRSRFRRPMLKFEKDGADGCHDMLITTCDQFRYELLGHVGPHANCADNLLTAMRRLGYQPPIVPQAVNFFARSHVAPDGRLSSPANTVPPGAYVELTALMDLVCAVSSCPFDLKVEGWEVSGAHAHDISELVLEVL